MTCSSPVRLCWDGQADPQGDLLSLAAGSQARTRSRRAAARRMRARGRSSGRRPRGGARRWATRRTRGAGRPRAGTSRQAPRTTSPRCGASRASTSTATITGTTTRPRGGGGGGRANKRCGLAEVSQPGSGYHRRACRGLFITNEWME